MMIEIMLGLALALVSNTFIAALFWSLGASYGGAGSSEEY
jgi:hypothetical protein